MSVPNYDCSECVHSRTGLCVNSVPAWDSNGQCSVCPDGAHWNYAADAEAQGRCNLRNAGTSDFLAGPLLPGTLSPENPSRHRENIVQVTAPYQLSRGSIHMPFGGQHQKPPVVAHTGLEELVPGDEGIGSLRAERMFKLAAAESAQTSTCPRGWTNCGAQGYPVAGPTGGPCVRGENVNCAVQALEARRQVGDAGRLGVGPRAPTLFQPPQPYPPRLAYRGPPTPLSTSPQARVYAFQHAPYLGGVAYGNTNGMQNTANKTTLSVFA
jgi:hypothetical protein